VKKFDVSDVLIRLNLIRIAGEFSPKLPEVLAVLPFVAWPD